MKNIWAHSDGEFARAVTKDADYDRLLRRLVKTRLVMTVGSVILSLCSLYVLNRDLPPTMTHIRDIPSSFVLSMAGTFFIMATQFTVDTSIKLLKAIKAAQKND
jgi:hypothetical protein